MENIWQEIERVRILPVVTVRKPGEAEDLLEGLRAGGLPAAEICFRTDHAEAAIRLAAGRWPDMLVGAGTVICGEQCERAIGAGAKFIVSPGLSEEVAGVCRARGIPYLPGAVTPTEIMKAFSLGLTRLKFFPAESFGGLKAIRALSAAFPQAAFMPTGGIGPENMGEYLSFPKVFACGGSWMAKGNREEIEQNTRAAVEAAKGVQRHGTAV